MAWPLNHHSPDAGVNYPRNTWWAAAFSGDVSRAPVGRWILDRPVLLYRTQDGRAVALDDRCPHRWAPLSKGTVVDDNIVCPYHGITFGPDGKGLRIPSQTSMAPRCKVRFLATWTAMTLGRPACDGRL